MKEIYNNLIKNTNNIIKSKISSDVISFNFIKSPFIEIKGNSGKKYIVQFIDTSDNSIVYEVIIASGCWARCSRLWYTKWLIRVKDANTNSVVYEHLYDATGKRVYIHLDSKSLGDTIAWMPYVEEFRKKNNCTVICSTFWNDLFKQTYQEIVFVEPGSTVNNLYAMYEVGWFSSTDRNKNKRDPRLISLQEYCSDALGIKYEEIIPTIFVKTSTRQILDKYVCIAQTSTAQAKYWNNETGWQEVVDHLNSIGYKVVVIQKEKTTLKNVIDKTGDIDIQDRISDLVYCDFFIGIGSGLSWLAWALKRPVILISGFSKPFAEFKTNIIRIINKDVCNGCFNNTKYEFDKGQWNWCPVYNSPTGDKNKMFECTKQIAASTVIEACNKIANVQNQRLWNKPEHWENNGDESWSVNFGTTHKMWTEFLYPRLNKYATGHILELAPGHGRITKYLAMIADKLSIVDLNQECITACKEKFKIFDNIEYFVNDGKSLSQINDNSIDFAISWDSVVHMHRTVIADYVLELFKKLKSGGYAFIHHSNLISGSETSTQNIAGRSNMTAQEFKEICESNGFEIISQEFVPWSVVVGKNVVDCITIFKKPVEQNKIWKVIKGNLSRHSEIPTTIELVNLEKTSAGFTLDAYRNGKFEPCDAVYNENFNESDVSVRGNIYEYGDCIISEGDVVVDIGANIGCFSEFAYRAGASVIYAYEPALLPYGCLLYNKPDICIAFKKLVSDTDNLQEKIYIDVTSDVGNSVFAHKNTNQSYFELVESITLKSIIDSLPNNKINFLKLDCEGAEMPIFESISDEYIKKIDKIALEYHTNILGSEYKGTIVSRMLALGYNSFEHYNPEISILHFSKVGLVNNTIKSF